MRGSLENLDAISAEEAMLWRTARSSDASAAKRARDTLFETHANFSRQVAARQYRTQQFGDLDIHDLRQLAYAGLLEAIDHFDPDRGIPFRGYASRRVSGSILDGLAKMSERREQYTAFRHRARSERVKSLTPEDSEALPAADAFQALADLVAGLAIGFMLDNGFAATSDQADERPDAYNSLAWKETLGRLTKELATLPPREMAVIKDHYLHSLSFEQIGLRLGVSKGRISQVHRAAIANLRKKMMTPEAFKLTL